MRDNSALLTTARWLAILPATTRARSKVCNHYRATLASLFQRGLSLNGRVHCAWWYYAWRFTAGWIGTRVRGAGMSGLSADTTYGRYHRIWAARSPNVDDAGSARKYASA